MKKILLGTLMVGALASSSFAIFQMDVPATHFPEGQAPESAVMTLFGNPTQFPATNILPADGFPLMFHVLFDYDATVPGGAVASVVLNSGSCSQTWTPAMFTVFYTPGPAFPVEGVYQPFTTDCYGPTCTPAPCTVDMPVLDFGIVHSNQPASLTFTLTNNNQGCDDMVVNLAEACDVFSVDPATFTLADGASQVVTVTFLGTHAGPTTCDIVSDCGATVTCVVDDQVAAVEVPAVFSLAEAYPNPFNPTTTIAYSVPENQEVVLNVFNTAGQLVQTLVNGMVERGEHKVVFDASNLSSGVYVYTLRTANETATQKMVLVK